MSSERKSKLPKNPQTLQWHSQTLSGSPDPHPDVIHHPNGLWCCEWSVLLEFHLFYKHQPRSSAVRSCELGQWRGVLSEVRKATASVLYLGSKNTIHAGKKGLASLRSADVLESEDVQMLGRQGGSWVESGVLQGAAPKGQCGCPSALVWLL